MKIVTIREEASIIEQLKKDLESRPEDAEDLNSGALKKIYQKERCVVCGELVSMLDYFGLCGYCVYAK